MFDVLSVIDYFAARFLCFFRVLEEISIKTTRSASPAFITQGVIGYVATDPVLIQGREFSMFRLRHSAKLITTTWLAA